MIKLSRFLFVRAERLELSHLAALDPKSSVSTNSTTPAVKFILTIANINNCNNLQREILYFSKTFNLQHDKHPKLHRTTQRKIFKRID